MDYAGMNGPELVRAFNAMATSVIGRELRAKPVNRFASPEVGRRRCEALASSIRARNGGLAEADARSSDIFAEFKTNTRKNRGKLLDALKTNLNTQLPLKNLTRYVYGSADMTGALKMVLRGLELSIKTKRLPYKLVKRREENGESSYGLYQIAEDS